jgi:hypothetical protein
MVRYYGTLIPILSLVIFTQGFARPGTCVVTEELSKKPPERSGKRIHVALPIRVTYWDSENKPCLEMACTYDISSRGARIAGLRCVKATGEIVAVERGRNRAFCRVIWVGEANSELHGQIGIQCVESERLMWETELRDMEEVYDPLQRDTGIFRMNSSAPVGSGNRRRQQRFLAEGVAELLKRGPDSTHTEADLKNLSETGCLIKTKQAVLPGTDLKLVLNVSNYDLSVKGQVRHAAEVGLGVEFREIRKGDKQMLQYLLRKLSEQWEEEEKPKAKSAVISF